MYIKVYTVIYLYVHLQKGHNHFSLQIRPYPTCDAGEFPKQLIDSLFLALCIWCLKKLVILCRWTWIRDPHEHGFGVTDS